MGEERKDYRILMEKSEKCGQLYYPKIRATILIQNSEKNIPDCRTSRDKIGGSHKYSAPFLIITLSESGVSR